MGVGRPHALSRGTPMPRIPQALFTCGGPSLKSLPLTEDSSGCLSPPIPAPQSLGRGKPSFPQPLCRAEGKSAFGGCEPPLGDREGLGCERAGDPFFIRNIPLVGPMPGPLRRNGQSICLWPRAHPLCTWLSFVNPTAVGGPSPPLQAGPPRSRGCTIQGPLGGESP